MLSAQIMQGQVGVHRVAAELLRRNMIPYFPSVDPGVDLIVNGCVRLQVKSTGQTRKNKFGHGHFFFTLRRAARFRCDRRIAAETRQFSTECDFVVCHAIDANRYWIVPAAVLDGKAAILFSAEDREQWKRFDVAAAKMLRAQGQSYKAIGAQLGTSWSTVQRRLECETAKRPYLFAVDYEDRWDRIVESLAILHEATHVAASTERDVPALSVNGVEP